MLSAGALLAPCALALPEDRQQPLQVVSDSYEAFLDRGVFVYRGTPAVATQGTMKISGLEITVERREDGVFTKVTATGMPARFQEQPEADQAIVHVSGNTLVFDNTAQLITADGNAESVQAGNTLSGSHIQYNIQTRTATANARDGELVNMFFPAPPPAPAPGETPAAPAPAPAPAPATEE
jgi:lipopolysaccharide export system protein LptA